MPKLRKATSSPAWDSHATEIDAFVAHLAARGFNAAYGALLDRVATSGKLTDVRADVALDDQFPLACDVTGAVQGTGCIFKV